MPTIGKRPASRSAGSFERGADDAGAASMVAFAAASGAAFTPTSGAASEPEFTAASTPGSAAASDELGADDARGLLLVPLFLCFLPEMISSSVAVRRSLDLSGHLRSVGSALSWLPVPRRGHPRPGARSRHQRIRPAQPKANALCFRN